MNLLLHLSPELEAKLKEQAAKLGMPPETVALDALKEKLTLGSELGSALRSDE